MAKNVCGLDFGTSNSAIAVMRNDSPEILPIGWNNGKTIRSVLYFPEGKSRTVYVGEQAIHEYIDRDMHGRFFQSVKTLLPDPGFDGTTIRGWGTQRSEQLASYIMAFLRNRTQEILGHELDYVVMGRPVRFSEDVEKEQLAIERLTMAARLAGFKEIKFQLEPIAAAYHYEVGLQQEELVLVADLGGGTTDFTLMRLSPQRRQIKDRQGDILGNAGVYIGGDRFDSLVMRYRLLKHFGQGSTYQTAAGRTLDIPGHLLYEICRWQSIPFLKNPKTKELIEYLLVNSSDKPGIGRLKTLIEDNIGFQLFRAIERAKVELSTADNSEISFRHSDIAIVERITRTEFEGIINEEVGKIESCMDSLLTEAAVTADKIDSVFVTGGTSLVPAVRNLLTRRFGEDKIRTKETFTSVASGLALTEF